MLIFRFATYLAFFIVVQACAPHYTYMRSTAQSSVGVNADIQPDPAVLAMVAPYKLQLDSLMEAVIGYAVRDIPRDIDMQESHLGNFCADLIQAHSEELIKKPIDLAIITIGGLRVPIPQGPIKIGTIFELMPFENEVVLLTIKGKYLMPAFERIITKKNISMSNSIAVFRKGELVSVTIGGQPIDLEKNYVVAVSDYLASGGDYMEFLLEASKTESTGKKVRDYIIDHVKELQAKGQQVNATIGQRVLIEE